MNRDITFEITDEDVDEFKMASEMSQALKAHLTRQTVAWLRLPAEQRQALDEACMRLAEIVCTTGEAQKLWISLAKSAVLAARCAALQEELEE